MAEFKINIAPEKEHLIKLLVEELGGEVIEKKKRKQPNASVSKKSTKKTPKKMTKVSPSFLFGKWKNLDIDAKKLREEAWDRSNKSL